MAWSATRTWVTAEMETAAIMNVHLRDNSTYLYTNLPTTAIPGAIIQAWQVDSLGGTDGHRPVVGATTYTDWHLCNGDANIDGKGITAPNYLNRIPVGAGTTYAEGETGGATTRDLTHTHAPGTLAGAATALGTHVQSMNQGSSGATGSTNIQAGFDFTVTLITHTHNIAGNTGAPVSLPTHVHVLSNATASAGSATQATMPPYRAQLFFCYIGP